MDDKKLQTIDKIYRLTLQDVEFNDELRKKLGIDSSKTQVIINEKRIDDIYEYCIEKVVKKQAQEFYEDFPLKSIEGTLVEDFCRMESFRRKDNFGDFCLSLYQQIENMTNRLCTNPSLCEIADKMWAYPAYIKTGKDISPSIENRLSSDYTIAALVFPGVNRNSGIPNSIEKSRTTLQSLYAIDKIRTVVYFLGFKAEMKASDYDYYLEITNLLNDIYQCRNMNHRGNVLNKWEEGTLQRVLKAKSFSYFKFIGALTQYVEFIKKGWTYLPDILSFARSLPAKHLSITGPKVLGKINVDQYAKKYNKK
jgi:hypothetical protein